MMLIPIATFLAVVIPVIITHQPGFMKNFYSNFFIYNF